MRHGSNFDTSICPLEVKEGDPDKAAVFNFDEEIDMPWVFVKISLRSCNGVETNAVCKDEMCEHFLCKNDSLHLQL